MGPVITWGYVKHQAPKPEVIKMLGQNPGDSRETRLTIGEPGKPGVKIWLGGHLQLSAVIATG